MPQSHNIETLEFDLTFGSEAEAWSSSQRFGDFVAERCVAVIGEVFDTLVDSESVLRLDRLEVDLGRGIASEAEFERRLRERLRSALEAVGPSASWPRASSAAAASLARHAADVDLLWHWLRRGWLPWSAGSTSAAETEALVARVLAARGEVLTRALRDAPDRSLLFARIARQWTSENLMRLLALLSPAGPTQAALTDTGPLRLAWERALNEAASVAESETAPAVGLAPEVVDEPPDASAWGRLLRGDARAARAALRRLGQDATGRRRLAASLGAPAWRDLLSLWGASPAETDLILALAELPNEPGAAGTPASPFSEAEARSAFAELLLDHLLAPGRDRLDLAAAATSLVARLASLEGVEPPLAARRLIAGWPRANAARLGEALEDLSGATSPARERERPDPSLETQRSRMEARLSRAEWADTLWRLLFDRDPAWLAGRLRHHGAAAAWRRSFASQLAGARLAALISLWVPARQVEPLAALVEASEAWALQPRRPPAVVLALLRQWLLAALLLADEERLDAAGVVAALVRERSRYDDLDAAETARAVAAALPPASRAGPMQESLRNLALRLDAEAASAAEARETRAVANANANASLLIEGVGRGGGLDVPAGPFTAAWLAELRSTASAEQARAIRVALTPSAAGIGRLRGLTEAQRRDLLALAAPANGPGALARADQLALAWSTAGLPAVGEPSSDVDWRFLLTELIEEGRPFEPGAFAERWLDGRIAALSPDARPAAQAAIDTILEPASSVGESVSIEGLGDADSRALQAFVGPEDLASALVLVARLTRTWVEAGLPTPPEGAAAANGRFLLRELIAEGRPFEPGAFAERWLQARIAALPPQARADARAAREAILGTASSGRAAPGIEGLSAAESGALRARIGLEDLDSALALAARLTRAWADAGLPTPVEGEAASNARFLVEEFVAAGRTFEAVAFEARWFATRIDGAPAEARAAARSLRDAGTTRSDPQPARRPVSPPARPDEDLPGPAPELDRTGAAALGLRLSRAWNRAGLPAPAGGWRAFNKRVLQDAFGEAGAELTVEGFTARWFAARMAAAPPTPRRAAVAALSAAGLPAPEETMARTQDHPSTDDLARRDQAPVDIAAGVSHPPGRPAAGRPDLAPGAAEPEAPSVSTPDAFTTAWLERLPRRAPPDLARALAAALTPAAQGLTRILALTEAGRRDLFVRIVWRDGPGALAVADRLAQAWTEAGLPSPAEGWPAWTWRHLLLAFFEQGRAFDIAGFTARWFAARVEGAPSGAAPGARAALIATLERMAGGDGDRAPGDMAQIVRTLRLAGAADSENVAVSTAARDPWSGEPAPQPDETIYIVNAGLVLAGVYIPILFGRLGLTANRAFVDEAAAERGVHLLQLLVDGGEPALDHQLVLNKVLCGLDLAIPLTRDFEASEAERDAIESLLRAMIERWSVIGRTSVAGLRESFLQRRGALRLEPDSWRLKVEPRAFDMLLDQIPWGYQTLKLPWMRKVMYVEWR